MSRLGAWCLLAYAVSELRSFIRHCLSKLNSSHLLTKGCDSLLDIIPVPSSLAAPLRALNRPQPLHFVGSIRHDIVSH